jgi:hypothetical protein
MKNLLYFSMIFLLSCSVPRTAADDEIFYESNAPVYDDPVVQNRPNQVEQNRPNGDGCYAKCTIYKGNTENNEMILPVYTGNIKSENIEVVKIVTSLASTKWIKKRADRNCLSSNPDDCLVWCLEEVPETIKKIECVKDTSLTKDFKFKSFTVQKRIAPAYSGTEWREILCKNKYSKEIMQDICAKLSALNYKVENDTNEVNERMKAAITQYQKDKGLPIGELNLETLRALKVDFSKL